MNEDNLSVAEMAGEKRFSVNINNLFDNLKVVLSISKGNAVNSYALLILQYSYAEVAATAPIAAAVIICLNLPK